MSSALDLRYNTAKAGIVRDPREWGTSAGYEFWFVAGNTDIVGTMTSTNDGLTGYGWTTTTSGFTEGSGGDLLSSADVDPTRALFASASANAASPRIFGSYDHGLQAARFLGYLPTKLTCEFYAGWIATASQANNTTEFIGMAGPAVVDCAAAGSGGCVRSGGNGSTFFLTSDNGSDAGANVFGGNTYGLFRIEYGATNTEWFIDNVSQGTITTEADIWPLSFRLFAGGTNDPTLVWARVFYS